MVLEAQKGRVAQRTLEAGELLYLLQRDFELLILFELSKLLERVKLNMIVSKKKIFYFIWNWILPEIPLPVEPGRGGRRNDDI